MKRLFFTLLSVLLLLSCFVGCAPVDEEWFLFTVWLQEDTGKPVDTALLDAYFTSNVEDYAKAKEENPDILSLFKNVTPDEMENKFSVYELEWGAGTEYLGKTYLVCDGEVYNLAGRYGRVYQFAYRGNTLYYSMDIGSGLYRFVFRSFNLKTKKRKWSEVIGSGIAPVSFYLSEDKKTLGIAEAGRELDEPNQTILYTDIRDVEWKS